MKILSAVAAMVLFFAVSATAETTNTLSDSEIQGGMLARKLCEIRPETNFTQTGLLVIRDAKGNRENVAVKFHSIVYPTDWYYVDTPTNWLSVNQAFPTNRPDEELAVTHRADSTNSYLHHFGSGIRNRREQGALAHWISPGTLEETFSRSDFWLCDLGLEFFYWPQQKILKKEVHRSCGCTVLESTNPNPSMNGYSRVVSWIDNDSLGIVEAYAYDSKNKLLKDFYPKDIKKVNGQWQVQTLVMENVQTGSRSRLEFDLKK
jgi:hypothetical protein